MPDSQDDTLTVRLRQAAEKVEEAMADVTAILQDLPSEGGQIGQTAIMTNVLQLAHRDLASSHALIYRVLMAHSGVIQRVLGAVLGRSLAESDVEAKRSGDGSAVLDPFRLHLADSALDVDRLVKSLSAIRLSMAEYEVDSEIDMPEWPDPVINFAGGMVDGAVESLDDARQLLYGAADLTEDRLVHIWAERIVGTAGSQEESKS